ncbi:TPA: GGDEF domain-containing protein, partial [Vibrio mimicus]
SRILSECCLKKEYPIRLGGDEFIVLLTPQRAEEFINQLSIMARKLNITFAYGITQATEATIHDALTRADKAMYQMKQQSKSGTGSTKNNTQINL